MYENDTALVVELIVENHSIVPSLHSVVVAVLDTSHGAVGGFAICVRQDVEIPRSNEILTCWQRSQLLSHGQRHTSSLVICLRRVGLSDELDKDGGLRLMGEKIRVVVTCEEIPNARGSRRFTPPCPSSLPVLLVK